jgi:hypothetical protein
MEAPSDGPRRPAPTVPRREFAVKKLGLNFLAVVVIALVAAGTSLAAAPANSAVPTVSGYVHAGYLLSAANGTWAGSPVAFTYQWQACSDRDDAGTCADIAGATSVTYTPSSATRGRASASR